MRSKGFTLVEAIIAMSMALILTIAVSQIVVNFYGGVLREQIRADLTADSKLILRTLVDELRVSSAVRSTNELIDPNSPAGGWNTDAANAIIVIASPSIDTDGNIVYDTLNNEPYLDETIYFAEDNFLYKRVLANPNATNNRLTTTCPESTSGPSCPSDPVLTDDFMSLNFNFFDQDNNPTSIIDEARSIDIAIELNKDTIGQDVNIVNNIRITLRNRDA